ncbi:MAG: phosphate/phosphite/phosphonate ABC transporter substrate-binding protein [Sphaerochaeta sp.]|uniref:phosphate/phosphite/phosphonate ABC transporter substrate-binding protein n=1 Tax=Sphaerochaeta sp. TaxID=1972642 RepID=UPI002FCADB79
MKKSFLVLLILLLSVAGLFAQGAKEATDSKTIDTLRVYYVPSREPAEIITVTEPLKKLLIEELAKSGYTVKKVDITVGTTYEAVGVALSAGTADVGLIPANTYLLYEDGCQVILTATRDGLSVDSSNPVDWNSHEPITAAKTQAIGYRALLIAGPSAKGKELSAKVNAGQKLTWDDLNSANWSVMSSTSPAGYVYPTLWLMDNYNGKTIGDLAHAVQSDSYGSAFARLAAGQVDVLVTYADARRDQESKWMDTYGRKASIWDETDVIGVTPMIYNDTVSVSKTSEKMTNEFIAALQTAFMNLNQTEEGRKVIAVYSHTGYQKAVSSDYDNERKAQAILKGLSK